MRIHAGIAMIFTALAVGITTTAVAMSPGEAAEPAPSSRAAAPDSTIITRLPSKANDPFSCPDGELPGLDIARFPTDASEARPSVVAALAAVDPAATGLRLSPLGTGTAPVWVSTGAGKTYIVNHLGNGWYAAPATVTGCSDPTASMRTVPSPN